MWSAHPFGSPSNIEKLSSREHSLRVLDLGDKQCRSCTPSCDYLKRVTVIPFHALSIACGSWMFQEPVVKVKGDKSVPRDKRSKRVFIRDSEAGKFESYLSFKRT